MKPDIDLADVVDALVTLTLAREGDDMSKITRVECVVHTFVFDTARLEAQRRQIKELLALLPKSFQPKDEGGGDGWSFVKMPFYAGETNDSVGEQWGEHLNAEKLLAMALGLGIAKWFVEDRNAWRTLPGGMPFMVWSLKEAACPPTTPS